VINFLLLFGVIFFTVAANLLIKLGVQGMPLNVWDFVSRLASLHVVLGLFFFAIAALLYLVVLSRMPLNVAQSFMALQFIAVVLVSRFFLSEAVTAQQWCGVLLIALGITIVGKS
jgi:drug/metabolite transporter (DMT)-like permease